ncbi:MAG: hypothetical protein Q7I94_00630 [Candidatus Contubernalis sp.]|nr:hypothetical protein [Candidatus Contubernalis sp.]
MFGGINWTEVLSLLLVCLTVLGAVGAYLKQSERSQKREHEQELMKVRLYTDRDIKTAQIETASLMQGFQEPAENQDSTQALINMALQNPEMINGLIDKFKNSQK